MTQQRKEPEAVANDVSGEARNVVQAHTIRGGVHIGDQSNRDICVVLEYRKDEVHVAVDHDEFLSVEISNRRPGSRQLTLQADGVPSTMWEIIPDVVSVSRDKPVRAEVCLRCTRSEPAAGPYQLVILAEDTEPGHRASWSSNVKQVIVPARPVLARTVTPTSRISTSGTYHATVALKNEGNTDLDGLLKIATEFHDDPRYLDAGLISLGEPEPFRLSRGATVHKPITLTFPTQPALDRQWLVPLVVDCHRDDLLVPAELSITQYGWLSDIPRYAVRVLRRLRAWGRQPRQYRRGALVGWVGAGFAVGSLVALLVAASLGDASGSTSAPRPSPTAPSSDTDLPCQPGMSAVLLASLTSEEAAAHATYLAERETNRMTRVKPAPTHHKVHLSSREQMCHDVVATARPQYAFFLWVGPVPSNEGPDVCKELGKTQIDDCFPVRMR